MKSVRLAVFALLGGAALFLLPANEVLAQAKGAKGAAKSSAPAVAAKSVNTGGAKAIGSSSLSKGSFSTATGQVHATRPIAGVGGGTVIIGGGFGPVYGGGYGYGYSGYTPFSPYLSGYPFQSGIIPIDYSGIGPLNYAYTPYAGPTLVDPTLNNVRGYPPSTMYPNASSRLYPGAVTAPPPQQGVEMGPAPQTAATASVQVAVPTADAELWFNGMKTQTQGLKREFVTPELSPGQTYTYELRARWVSNGKQYDETRSITLRAGSQIVVNISVDGREQLPVPSGIKI